MLKKNIIGKQKLININVKPSEIYMDFKELRKL